MTPSSNGGTASWGSHGHDLEALALVVGTLAVLFVLCLVSAIWPGAL